MSIQDTIHQSKYCDWSRADADTDLWEGTCGVAFCLNDGTPTENEMKFCPRCGRKLIELKDEPEAT